MWTKQTALYLETRDAFAPFYTLGFLQSVYPSQFIGRASFSRRVLPYDTSSSVHTQTRNGENQCQLRTWRPRRAFVWTRMCPDTRVVWHKRSDTIYQHAPGPTKRWCYISASHLHRVGLCFLGLSRPRTEWQEHLKYNRSSQSLGSTGLKPLMYNTSSIRYSLRPGLGLLAVCSCHFIRAQLFPAWCPRTVVWLVRIFQ